MIEQESEKFIHCTWQIQLACTNKPVTTVHQPLPTSAFEVPGCKQVLTADKLIQILSFLSEFALTANRTTSITLHLFWGKCLAQFQHGKQERTLAPL